MSARRGVLLFVVLLTVLGTGVLIAAMTFRQPREGSTAESVLVYDVPSQIEEGETPFSAFSLGLFRRPRATLFETVTALHRAADDDNIRALVLHIDGLDWGWAQIAELRDVVLEFRNSGKPVFASLSGGGEAEYLLASAASRISAPPTATLQLDGLTATATFLRGTYDKVGISPNFAHVGRYKAAVEHYTRTGMSPDSRAALESLLEDEYRILVDSLGAARHFAPDSVRRLLDDGPYPAGAALAAGLIDTLLHEADLDSVALRRAGKRYASVLFNRYLDRGYEGGSGAHIALVVAEGEIVSGKSRDEPFQGRMVGSESVVRALREARTRRSVRAIVMRIDSPGGSGQASDDIWREVVRCRQQKPVIVSMSSLAASGGYYIAVGADSIVAQPSTLTGSIGVFGGKLNLLGLYHKLGIDVETVTRGKHADMMSPFRDFTPEESQRFQQQLEDFYRIFLERVAAGRHRSTAEIDSIAQGRVWSGTAALRLGLIDALGGLDRAIEMARARAHIDEDEHIVVDLYPRQHRTFLQRTFGDLFDEQDEETFARLRLPEDVAAWVAASRFPLGVTLALMPFTVRIR